MSMKSVLKITALTLACWPMTFQAGYAARIYNDLPTVTVQVVGLGLPGGQLSISIPARSRSGSLEWPGVYNVIVNQLPDQTRLCSLSFGPHAQIQGGNYMKGQGMVLIA